MSASNKISYVNKFTQVMPWTMVEDRRPVNNTTSPSCEKDRKLDALLMLNSSSSS